MDRDFRDLLDALSLIDLRRTDPRLLRPYTHADRLARYLAWHVQSAAV